MILVDVIIIKGKADMSFLDKVPVVSSYRKSSEADEIVERAKSRARRADRALDDAQEKSKRIIDCLIDDKLEYTEKTIPASLNTLKKCQKINELDTQVAKQAYLDFEKLESPQLHNQAIEFSDLASTGVKGTTTGAALALGSMSAVSSFGAASTGTAIASLSGAAAQNATLAWFGGGALSAGGAGIAGGTMVLGGLALAPLAVFGAMKYAKHAEKKLTAAVEYKNEVSKYVATIEGVIDISTTLNKHVELYQHTLRGIADRLEWRESLLSEQLEKDSSTQKINQHKLEVILLIKTLKKLMNVEVIDSEQKPTQKSIDIINKANELSDECIISFINDMNDENVKKSDLRHQNSAASFFWFTKEKKENNGFYSKSEKETFIGSFIILFFFLWLSSFLLERHWDFLGVTSGFFASVCALTIIDTLTKNFFEKITQLLVVISFGFSIYYYGWVL